jgi:hypothetical protein
MFIVCFVALLTIRAFAGWVHEGYGSVFNSISSHVPHFLIFSPFKHTLLPNSAAMWTFITQIIPGCYDSCALSQEPGTCGRVLRVTAGVSVLFLTAYYQSMLLDCLLMSQNQERSYTLSALADDIGIGRTRLLLPGIWSSTAIELQTLDDENIVRLRQAAAKTTIQYEAGEHQFLQRILNELPFFNCI